jgi:signal peptidase
MSTLLRRSVHALGIVLAAASIGVFLLVGVGPRTGRFQVLTVLTGSMAPGIPQGSLAVVEPKARHELQVGDVITYAIPVEDHRVVTHRVIEVRQTPQSTIVRTKGDANEAPDPWVAELTEPTVWIERFAVPHAGAAIAALRSSWAQRLGQLAPFLLALSFLRALWGRGRPADALAT